MKERPIIFSAPMVRAILEGRKTVTRRVVKPQPSPGHEWAGWCVSSTTKADEGKAVWAVGRSPYLRGARRVRCPYGQPGDRLWVRETFCFAWDNERECWPDPERYLYRADGVEVVNVDDGERSPWKPSIHMPRRASRITLEVTGVHVERLQNISRASALAEGIADLSTAEHIDFGIPGEVMAQHPVRAFQLLWESINGAGSWDANPWVWVVEFKRVAA